MEDHILTVKEAMGWVECFVSLFRTATPFLKTTVKKVGKRMLNTGLDTGMQMAQDVLNRQPVRKAAKSRAKAAG